MSHMDRSWKNCTWKLSWSISMHITDLSGNHINQYSYCLNQLTNVLHYMQWWWRYKQNFIKQSMISCLNKAKWKSELKLKPVWDPVFGTPKSRSFPFSFLFFSLFLSSFSWNHCSAIEVPLLNMAHRILYAGWQRVWTTKHFLYNKDDMQILSPKPQ